MKYSNLKKIHCELCGETNQATLHKHHIIPRTDPNTSNHPLNLLVVCGNCHQKVHDNQIIVVGIYPSTKLPYGRTVIFETNGTSNCPEISTPYFTNKKPSMEVK